MIKVLNEKRNEVKLTIGGNEMVKSVVKKLENKKVLALYLLGVLLLSTGVSFAYFSSQNSTSGSGGVATVETATVIKEGVISEGNISFSDTDIYPGHMAIASIKVTGIGDNIPKIYHVIFNGTNTFTTPINYTVYKTENNIDASYSCEVRQEYSGSSRIYYEECTGTNIEELGTPITTGTITQGEGVKTTLKSDEIILTSIEGKEIYYYVVFEYPNIDANQNADIGSTISGNINIEEGGTYQDPEIMMLGNTTAGSNGWVKSANITTTITTHTGNYNASYCVTTNETCTPDTSATMSDNSFNVALDSNASAQKVCVRVEDEYNQVKEGCSEGYKVDNTNPTSNITLASSTTGSNGWYQSATINIIGSDTYSGVSNIRYCTTTSSSCTPSTNVNGSSTNITLTSNASAQRVCAYAIDTAGNISSTTCSSAYSVDTTNPAVSITSTSATTNTISVTVSGSDAHSGIYQYRFSINGGSSYTTVTSSNSSYTYTFNNLSSGTTYNIAVQSVDRSGRISSTASRSVTTEKAGNTMQTILAGYNKDNRGSFSTLYTASTTKTVFQTTDWKGTSYYFAGAPTDNWVYCGGFYWRIVRVNGDGTVRPIYNGTSTATTGASTVINNGETQTFNNSYNRSEYVGLKYTVGEQHGQNTNSTILDTLQTWYNSSGLSTYAEHIDSDIGFCSDRNMASGYTWYSQPLNLGYNAIYYAPYARLYPNGNPILDCNSSDIIKEPIGLITTDEISLAGGVWKTDNTSYYLWNNQNYWTMSPNSYSPSNGVSVFVMTVRGFPAAHYINNMQLSVRPVINLKADTLFTGSGTTTVPYVVSGY